MNECKCHEVQLSGFTRRTIKGVVVPLAPKPGWQHAHDCDYIVERNSLIPTAESIADDAVAAMPEGLVRDQAWSRTFLGAMDDLARGLRAC